MTSREIADKINRRARKAGVPISPLLLDQLDAYYRLLERWNAKINLTSFDLRAASDQAIDRLLVEPLLAARLLPNPASPLIDIGSGGGSPAIPLKLARPDLTITLVEAKVRKSAFLREASRQLSVRLLVETARYETLLPRPDLHEAFNLLTVRAVRIEQRALLSLQAFLRPGGHILLFGASPTPHGNTVLPPQLVWMASQPLVDSLQSRLTVLQKRDMPPLSLPAAL